MDLKQHLLRQMAFSRAAFGPGRSTERVLDHIQKEIEEVRESGGDPNEWVDLVILSLDGLTRSILFSDAPNFLPAPEFTAGMACDLVINKQGGNEAREWPDWRTADPDKALEHVRDDEGPVGDHPYKPLPCPFCGGEAVTDISDATLVWCRNKDCYAQPKTAALTWGDAVAQWNDRPQEGGAK